jgi:hypothetical protein
MFFFTFDEHRQKRGLITSCGFWQDFFYICTGHLTDRGFCSPDADEVAALKAKKQKEELDKEIAKVTAEYEERKKNREKKKAERKKKKDKDKDKKADKEEAKKEDEEEEKDDKEKEAKLEALQTEGGKAEDSPRIFSLHKYVLDTGRKTLKRA